MQDSFVSATEFWMGVECLSPSSAPKCKKEAPGGPQTWEVSADPEVPWLDPAKIAAVQSLLQAKGGNRKSSFTVQYTAYCGLIPVPQVVELIRQHFGVKPIEEPEPRRPEPIATLALTLNAHGFVVGDPFVSSLPWAVNQVLSARSHEHLDFTGFFGTENVLEKLLAELERAMERLYLVKASTQSEEAEAQPTSEGELKPLSLAAVEALCKQIYTACGWNPSNQLSTIRIQAKIVGLKQAENEESSDLLNSFFVEDLGKTRLEIKRGNYGAALNTFMTGRLRSDRIDIRSKVDTFVEKALAPDMMPLGCWPSEHGLVRAQQFAVNKIMQQLGKSAGIFSVNGPPGTGKTTLLRDIVAAVVVERAHSMCNFVSPLDAFSERISAEGWAFGKLWALDPSLAKSGIVVASSNNGAVENITKELPGIKALPAGSTLRYLSAVSDSVATLADAKERNQGTTWGLIAAVMGNKSNRKSFFQKMRWSPKNSGEGPLAPLVSLWELMDTGQHTALPWDVAVDGFEKARSRASKARARMQSISVEIKNKQAYARAIPSYEKQLVLLKDKVAQSLAFANQAKTAADQAATGYRNAKVRSDALGVWKQASVRAYQRSKEFADGGYQDLDDELVDVERSLVHEQDSKQVAERLLAAVRDRKPGFFARLFSLGKKTEQWESDTRVAEDELRGAARSMRAAEKVLGDKKSKAKARDRLKTDIRLVEAELTAAEEHCSRLGISSPSSSTISEEQLTALEERARATAVELDRTRRALAEAEIRVQQGANELRELRAGLASAEQVLQEMRVTSKMEQAWLGSGLSEDQLQLESPWSDDELFQVRQELFCRAMELHESFIAHSWPKLKNNLSALISINKGEISAYGVSGGVNRLWDSMFMVVPVISTTFASFARMFDGWGKESIGWLLIDEAGQAPPQAAMGAIWRSERVVVVGDPLQIEPVVSFPRQLMVPLMDRCRAEHVYHPMTSSVQVLADMGNQFGTLLGVGEDAKWLGSPLRVHRRCLDPMFSVSNAISYDNMMVYGTGEHKGDLWFGESAWIEVPATSRNGNSVPEQVAAAVQMAAEFEKHYGIKSEGKYNLYLITPFKDVRNALEDALRSRIKNRAAVSGMFGTVHTFQGKEADVVIFVLGGTPGSISSFAADKANLLNVALTRAKKRVYVIGAKADWARAPFYSTLYHNPKLEKRDTVPPIILPNLRKLGN
jgi:hypothetical protein